LGLTADLLPVVSDPNAKISALSKMRDLGKVPSRFNGQGEVVGFPKWTQHRATDAQVGRWSQDTRLGICIQTRHARAIDVDIADPVQAGVVRDCIEMAAGALPCRTRPNSGKFLLVFKMAGDFTKRVIKTAHGNIEFLATGQQFIAVGTHPSGARYEWAGGLPDALPGLTMAEFDALWDGLASVFGIEGGSSTQRTGAAPTQPRVASDVNDHRYTWLIENEWATGSEPDGRLHVRCPFEGGHSTDTGPSSTTYFPAGVGGFDQGHFKCLHASCSGRTDGDFLEAVGYAGSAFEVVELDPAAEAEGAAAEARNAQRNSYGAKVDQTDLGNVNLLASLTAGDLRYVVDDEVWLRWTAGRWEVDRTKQHTFAATVMVAEHYARGAAALEAQLAGMDRATARQHQKRVDAVRGWEKACRNRRGIENMLALATRHPAFVISASALNTSPYLLGVQNGVVDLRTGDLRPDARDDFVTRRSAYAYRPAAAAPRWGRFMAEVTGYPIAAERDGDGAVIASTVGRFRARPEYADYLQRALGYSATGLTVEHKMFCVFGEHGSNGKNVAFDAVKSVLGGYAATVSNMLLLAGKRGRDANDATPALMPLKGARLALCSEPPAGATFDNAVVKALVGEAKISGRENYGRVGEIAVAFHLWMLCNEKPRVEHLEGAMASRILMLPFDREWNRPGSAEHDPALPDADKGLATELQAEGEGILAWLVQGAMRYFAVGLQPCAEVAAATKTYFAAQRVDPIGMWIAGLSICAPASGETATALFNHFSAWRLARESAGSLRGGESPVTLTAFGLALRKRGIESAKHGCIRYGVSLGGDFEVQPDQAAIDETRRVIAEFGHLA